MGRLFACAAALCLALALAGATYAAGPTVGIGLPTPTVGGSHTTGGVPSPVSSGTGGCGQVCPLPAGTPQTGGCGSTYLCPAPAVPPPSNSCGSTYLCPAPANPPPGGCTTSPCTEPPGPGVATGGTPTPTSSEPEPSPPAVQSVPAATPAPTLPTATATHVAGSGGASSPQSGPGQNGRTGAGGHSTFSGAGAVSWRQVVGRATFAAVWTGRVTRRRSAHFQLTVNEAPAGARTLTLRVLVGGRTISAIGRFHGSLQRHGHGLKGEIVSSTPGRVDVQLQTSGGHGTLRAALILSRHDGMSLTGRIQHVTESSATP